MPDRNACVAQPLRNECEDGAPRRSSTWRTPSPLRAPRSDSHRSGRAACWWTAAEAQVLSRCEAASGEMGAQRRPTTLRTDDSDEPLLQVEVIDADPASSERRTPLHHNVAMIALSRAAANDRPVMPARTTATSSAVVVGCGAAGSLRLGILDHQEASMTPARCAPSGRTPSWPATAGAARMVTGLSADELQDVREGRLGDRHRCASCSQVPDVLPDRGHRAPRKPPRCHPLRQ